MLFLPYHMELTQVLFACSSVCQFIAVDFPNHFLSFHLLRTILNLLSSFTETDFLITLNFKFKQVFKSTTGFLATFYVKKILF